MIKLESTYRSLLLEALEDMMYKLSLQLEDHKGGPMDKSRKVLTAKQAQVEKLQHIISSASP